MNASLLVAAGLTVLMAVASAMDAEEIRKLAGEPHDRANLVAELKVFPDAREYRVTTKSATPGEKPVDGPAVTAIEKTVGGRYIVSEALVPGAEQSFVTVVTFEKEDGVFKKWILAQDGTLGASTGVADFEKRTIAWVTEAPDHSSVVLALEIHSDDKSTWKETILQGGKVVGTTEGAAIRTK